MPAQPKERPNRVALQTTALATPPGASNSSLSEGDELHTVDGKYLKLVRQPDGTTKRWSQPNFGRVASATSYVASKFDNFIAITSTAAARAVTLPAPTADMANTEVVVKDESGGAATNNITVSAASGNIDGGATSVINTNYGVRRFYCNGTQWYVC